MARVVWENTGITSGEVEGSGKTTTDVDSSTGVSAVEVEPLLSLYDKWLDEIEVGVKAYKDKLTVGCQ